jgi:hypothetical protein
MASLSAFCKVTLRNLCSTAMRRLQSQGEGICVPRGRADQGIAEPYLGRTLLVLVDFGYV